MKIGAIADSLDALSFDELLGTAAELGIERSEFVARRWSKRAARLNLRTCRRFRICSLNSGCSAICRPAGTARNEYQQAVTAIDQTRNPN
jgi:hypothetical protein